ncbi:hypothetical protein SteCoe_15948 [Stentor coeruleus]|uniref:Transmembrane protein 131-like N-terminal domain-containing protein n=1 Tax=Stentor coeruleus TaxID=5963 RepID=A0A1R2BU62_9CILI|nr:hypothetical protein SteCoe_19401 [Stentor coeruleus]OMJ83170.1 hypothetical protein SteCoe_15948 [Stentor coeruleus]
MGLYRLVVFIVIQIVATSTLKSPTPSSEINKETRALLNILQSKDAHLSDYLSKTPILLKMNWPSPVFLFEPTSMLLTVPMSKSETVLKYISLVSPDFSIKQLPKLKQKYMSPVKLDILFTPTAIGIRSDYLVLCTETETLIYYLQGIGEESGFNLQTVNIEYIQGTYGVFDLIIDNPFNDLLEVISLKVQDKDVSVEKKSMPILGHSKGEICTLRAYFSQQGEYKTSLEIQFHANKFILPIYVKVLNQGLNVPKTISFSILNTYDRKYYMDIIVKNPSKNSFKIQSLKSMSSVFEVSFDNKIVPAHSDKFIIGKVRFHMKNEGFYTGAIELRSNDKIYIIECTATSTLSILEISAVPLVYNPYNHMIYNVPVTNYLGHDLHIKNIQTFTGALNISNPEKLFSNEESKVKVMVLGKQSSYQLVKFHTNIGIIQSYIRIEDPVLSFAHLVKGVYENIYGPLELGYISYESSITVKLSIKNSNRFDVVIDLIESIPHSKIEMPKRNTIYAQDSLEFAIVIKGDRSLFNPVIFHTSIGSFFITAHLSAVPGYGKVKSIYFGEVVPGTTKEQLIYFTNNFPVPVHIQSISSPVDSLTFETTKELVLPDKEQVIGKVKILYSKKNEIIIDWNKYLTYGEARTWNQLQRIWEDGEKVGSIVVTTDVAGKIEVPVFIGFKKPQMEIDIWPNFDYCSIDETCTSYLKVYNPLQVPIMAQLLAAPDFLQTELKKFDCSSQYLHQNYVDDEFENVNNEYDTGLKRRECIIKPTEEIPLIKHATEKRPRRSQELNLQDQSLLEKILSVINPKDDVSYSNLLKTQNEEFKSSQNTWQASQSYFIGGKNTILIPPKTSKVIGPIYFQPLSQGLHNLSFILRNNYTLIETMNIHTNVAYSKLAFMKRTIYFYNGKEYVVHKTSLRKEQHKLIFDITSDEMSKFLTGGPSIISPIFVRSFELQNVGNIDAEIQGISFEGDVCEFEGYILIECNRSFILGSQEGISVQMYYNPAKSFANRNAELQVFTSTGRFSITVESKLPEDFNLNVFAASCGDEALIATIACIIVVLVLLIKYDQFDKKIHYRSKSTKDYPEITFGVFFCKKYSQPIFFAQTQEIPTVPIETEKTEETTEIVGIIQPPKSRKKTKIRRNLANTIIENAENLKTQKHMVQVPEIIATNKLLMEKRIGKPSVNSPLVCPSPVNEKNSTFENPMKKVRAVSDDPAPKPKESSESLSVEPEEDFFIDSYKKSSLLFGFSSDQESASLAELTED